MVSGNTHMGLCLAVFIGIVGCHTPPVDKEWISTPGVTTTVQLKHLPPAEANKVLSTLQLGSGYTGAQSGTIEMTGSVAQRDKALCVLTLMDREEDYRVDFLGPASRVRQLPSNGQIARTVGDITLGTFARPPAKDALLPGLLDIHQDHVILVVPDGYTEKVRQAIAVGQALLNTPTPAPPAAIDMQASTAEVVTSRPTQTVEFPIKPVEALTTIPVEGRDVFESHAPPPRDTQPLRGVLQSLSSKVSPPLASHARPLQLTNGEDMLELTLPGEIDLIELLDLAGEYLDLDYVYDAAKIRNQRVALRLHGKRSGELRVKDLYTLLETALKFKGLVMTRQEGNLVAIVPVVEALDADPTLITPEQGAVHAGDMVVTRVFALQHVEVAHVLNLMQTMKLGVAVVPIPETQTLFVTCYAHRMPRIEELVHIVDRPGRSREFRFRHLQHTVAQTLADKVQALAVEMQDITVTMATTTKNVKPPGPISAPRIPGTFDTTASTVYLDTDERTNRLLMIGVAPQLDLVEQLIDILDVAHPTLHTLRVYGVRHLEAQDAAEKLTQLGILGETRNRGKPVRGTPARIADREHPEDLAQATVIEATNSLLVHATREQHERVQSVLQVLDVTCSELRNLHVYTIDYVEAREVLEKLRAMGIPESGHTTSASPTASIPEKPTLQTPPQITILEATNALLVNASAGQHMEIATLIELMDVQTQKEAIPYEIYFLENQSPEHLAEVLNRIAQKTIVDVEDKVISKKRRDASGQIIIVPDELTFSLIVYANRKNQEWIRVLIEQLDRQQSQVLIDVTLVEISKTDEFNLDLNLITGIPDMVATSGLMEPVSSTVTTQDIIDKLHASGRNRFIDLQSNSGRGNAFYGDEQVMLLINAMDEKKYGRVLAKPKVLVNDNETGTITTKDTTYVKETKQSVLPGNSEAVITSEEFTSYEAGITLEIVPHINEDDLLRLNITMTRSDFTAADGKKPPDQSSSDVTTVVTIPDGSTIILGGMLKMNQTKGLTKVPGLGDVPIFGGLFRGSHRTDLQKRLYIFVKAEIIRPAEALANKEWDLKRISDENRAAFEAMEKRFQDVQLWPGVESRVTDPCQVLETR